MTSASTLEAGSVWCEQTSVMPAKKRIEPPGRDLYLWWRNSPYFQLDQGHSVAKAGSGIVYDTFLKPMAFVAWTYELVRRLPDFKTIEKRIGAEELSTRGVRSGLSRPAHDGRPAG